MGVPEETLKEVRVAAAAAAHRLAEHIVGLDVSERLGITDAFLLAAAPTERQVLAIVDEIEERLLKECSVKPKRREGLDLARWVLLDYGHFVVHVQHSEERTYFALESIYDQVPRLDLALDSSDAGAREEAES